MCYFLTFIFFSSFQFFASRICVLASSGSQNSGQTLSSATSVPTTPSGNVNVAPCSIGVMYKLYPVEVIFLSPKELWVFSDGHILPKLVTAIFDKRLELE